jgi:hypothetical protein
VVLGHPTKLATLDGLMPSTRCCRSCPRCDDCPVLVAATARAQRHESATLGSLVDEVFAGVGLPGRMLPESVIRTLESLEAARRGSAVAAAS